MFSTCSTNSPTYFIESGENLNTLLSKLSQTEHINVISVNDTSFIRENHNRFAQSHKFYGGNKMKTLSDGKIAYSGGDNLFTVGQWDRIAEPGQEIYKEFEDYTNHYPDFSLFLHSFHLSSRY